MNANSSPSPRAGFEPPVIRQAPVRKKRRWWLYVLIGFACLILLGIALVIGVVAYVNSLVTRYTETQPITLAAVDASPAAQEKLKAKWEAFRQAVMEGRLVRSLTLSAADLNVLLANHPDLKDRLRFAIHGDKLQGAFTIPLDRTGQQRLKGRHLNGLITFDLKLEYGFLTLKVAALEANGKPVPRWLLRRLQREDLLQFLDQNREVTDLVQRLETVEVQDGLVVVTPRDDLAPVR